VTRVATRRHRLTPRAASVTCRRAGEVAVTTVVVAVRRPVAIARSRVDAPSAFVPSAAPRISRRLDDARWPEVASALFDDRLLCCIDRPVVILNRIGRVGRFLDFDSTATKQEGKCDD
jgi:ABC-type enterobactin transport system permease subunit